MLVATVVFVVLLGAVAVVVTAASGAVEDRGARLLMLRLGVCGAAATLVGVALWWLHDWRETRRAYLYQAHWTEVSRLDGFGPIGSPENRDADPS